MKAETKFARISKGGVSVTQPCIDLTQGLYASIERTRVNHMRSERTNQRILLACTALAAVSIGHAQVAPAGDAQANRAPTWAQMQQTQSWATRNLAKSPHQREWVKTSNSGRTLKAWVVSPNGKKKLPVVLVLHEVFGLTDSTRNTADQIAGMGYLVIVPDMLSGRAPGGGDTDAFETSRAASETVTALPDDVVNSDVNAWADYGTKLPRGKDEFAIVGLSWGGGAAFRYAASSRPDLKAVFVFYDVGPPALTQGPDHGTGQTFPADRIKVPVFGFYPSKDTRVMQSLPATIEALTVAGKPFDHVVYQGAEHAYMRVGSDPKDTNPANAAAVKASLERLKTQLRQVLNLSGPP